MYGARNQFFACSCFTCNENSRIASRNFRNARKNTLQSGRCSNDLFEHRSLVDFFTQSDVFPTKPVFRLLAVFDVGPARIPTCDLSLFVPQRVKTSQEPAITSVMFAYSQLQFVRGTAGESTIGIGLEAFRIVRMSSSRKTRIPPFVEAYAEIIERGPICVEAFA